MHPWKIYAHKIKIQLEPVYMKKSLSQGHGVSQNPKAARPQERKMARQCLEHPPYLKDAQLVPHLWLNICLILISWKTGFFCSQLPSHLSEEQLQP